MNLLLVDPGVVAGEVLAEQLRGRGYTASTLSNSAEALARFQEDGSIDAVIASYGSRPYRGPELARRLRAAAGDTRPVHIIVTSAAASNDDIIAMLDGGADEFMPKPLNIDELDARLRTARRQNKMHESLISLATVDALTGAMNRRAFLARLEAVVAVETDVCAIMIDVDHFKSINDRWGHSGGDDVLRRLACDLMSGDLTVGRLGGEEFAIVLPACRLERACREAERMRARIETETDGGRRGVTCSFGVAALMPPETGVDLLKRADDALYEAKRMGRNRVEVARPRPNRSIVSAA